MDFLSPTAAAGLLAVYAVAQFVGKAIPDSATGFPGFVRKVAKVISLYAPNKL